VSDADHLARAIALARDAMRSNRGGPFGAVVVRDGVVLGEGANSVLATSDPTAHAEVVAIRAACAHIGTFRLDGATIYASSEPCPMCLAAIYWSRLERIVYAAACDVAAAAGFDDTFFYDELRLEPAARRVPMRQDDSPDARALFEEWKRKPDKTPY
jgi:tRNA(Arg) A34 adenosine deaminase TadA